MAGQNTLTRFAFCTDWPAISIFAALYSSLVRVAFMGYAPPGKRLLGSPGFPALGRIYAATVIELVFAWQRWVTGRELAASILSNTANFRAKRHDVAMAM